MGGEVFTNISTYQLQKIYIIGHWEVKKCLFPGNEAIFLISLPWEVKDCYPPPDHHCPDVEICNTPCSIMKHCCPGSEQVFGANNLFDFNWLEGEYMKFVKMESNRSLTMILV